MVLRFGGAGDMSCRIASKTTLNWRSYLLSSSLRRRESSAFEASIWRSLTKARTTSTLARAACGLLRMLAAMMTPCSVKANGRDRRPPLTFEITICDLKDLNSSADNWNMKSVGNRQCYVLQLELSCACLCRTGFANPYP